MTGLCMKQFEKMGWIRQGFLGLIVCAVMSPSHAMSVRERYLLQHPQAAAHQDVEKAATPAKVIQHVRKHRAVEKEIPVRQKAVHRRHVKVEQPIEKKSVEKHSRVHQVKSHHERVIVPKLAKPKFNRQQARDAEAALNHRKVKQEAPVSRHKRKVTAASIAKHATHHAVKRSTEHRVAHHKRHHAG